MIRNKFTWTMIVVTAFSLAALFTSTASALCPSSCQYPSAGRDFYKGYFTGAGVPVTNTPGTFGAFWQVPDAPWTVNSPASFGAFIQSSLFDTSNGSVNNRSSAAAYIVTAMMGHKGTDFTTVLGGVNTARSEFAAWQALVVSYNNAGLVVWNDTVTECPGDVQANLDYTSHDSYYFSNTFLPGCVTDPALTFLNPTTHAVQFRIKKSCGNPIGDNKGLPPVTDPPYGTVNPPTPGVPTATPPTPDGYNTGNTTVYSSCAFTTGTAHDPANDALAVPITVTFSGGATGTATGTSSTTSPYRYSVATPTSVKNSINPVTATVVGKANSGATYAIGSITFGPCLLPTPSCGVMTVSPTSVDPTTPYSITTSVKYGSMLEAQTAQAQPNFRYFITVTGPSGYNQNVNVTPSGPDPATFTFTGSSSFPATGNTGTYTVGWGIISSFGPINCGSAIPANSNPPYFTVTNKPYFKVTGGDISAGAGMSTGGLNCASGGVAPNPNASIVSWNRGLSGSYGGAGTQYGALALKHLLGFSSGQGTSLAPSQLSFANTGASDQVDESRELYGGQFGSTACTADYFANATNIQTGNITIGATNIANGTHQTIYVNGNVYITGNIVFTGALAGYPDTASVPSYSIIVKGNIYVAPGVTQLDGFYIAQPSSGAATNGVIYSCAPFSFGTNAVNVLTSTLQANCNTSLTVNGAFVGRQVWLLRTAGSVNSNTAAETFNYSPDVWLSTPFGNGLTPGTTDEYDSITSLPPVL
jgi:hypothetical protein